MNVGKIKRGDAVTFATTIQEDFIVHAEEVTSFTTTGELVSVS